MLKHLKYLFGRYSHLLVLLLALTGMVSLTGCGVNPLSLLTGGGPNVAANVQAGKTNSQTIGTTENFAPTVSVRPNSRVETVDQSKTDAKVASDNVERVIVNEVQPWVILLLIIGWLAPSPNEIGRWLFKMIKRRKQ